MRVLKVTEALLLPRKTKPKVQKKTKKKDKRKNRNKLNGEHVLFSSNRTYIKWRRCRVAYNGGMEKKRPKETPQKSYIAADMKNGKIIDIHIYLRCIQSIESHDRAYPFQTSSEIVEFE